MKRKTMKTKQVSIQLPHDVILKAEQVARSTKRPDGLKQTPTATIREWVLKGMEHATAASR